MATANARRNHRASPHQPIESASNPSALLRRQTVEALTGLGRSALYQRIAEGTFPAPVRLSSRCARWNAGSVTAWLESVGKAA